MEYAPQDEPPGPGAGSLFWRDAEASLDARQAAEIPGTPIDSLACPHRADACYSRLNPHWGGDLLLYAFALRSPPKQK